LNVAVPKETTAGERRVGLTPDAASRIAKSGSSVMVESGAGASAGFIDSAYQAAGAKIVPDAATLYPQADFVLKVQRPQDSEIGMVRQGSALIALLSPLTAPQTAKLLAARNVTSFGMELIPRISRAQGMDALSSQATVSGYKAVLLAAEALPKFFPMLMTAAGTIAPSKVLVLGAGVAGLQAIATARRLGAVVSGFDTRPVVKEQVESLGATFVSPPITGEGTGGYARELTADEQRTNRDALGKFVADSDVVITTALVPGRRAPILITEDMLKAMRPGSVIVDLAAEAGGNTETATPGSTTVSHDVTLIAPFNVPSTMPLHASQLYAKNVLALFDHLVKDGKLVLDMNDEITKGVCITNDGKIVNPTVAKLVEGGAA
jgi:proton-translocating NAD(P)+ transhydrogenase subunit alpha